LVRLAQLKSRTLYYSLFYFNPSLVRLALTLMAYAGLRVSDFNPSLVRLARCSVQRRVTVSPISIPAWFDWRQR
jgi:hypothetical protein